MHNNFSTVNVILRMNLAGFIVIIALLLTIMFFASKNCAGLSCQKEGFKITCMGSDWGQAMKRTPVDFVFSEGGYRSDPHWQADPTTKFQPLDMGPVDFYRSERRLDEDKLFQNGCGMITFNLMNDDKNRGDTLRRGGYQINRFMQNAPNPAFGAGVLNTELQYQRPEPFQKIYGGDAYLIHDRFGN